MRAAAALLLLIFSCPGPAHAQTAAREAFQVQLAASVMSAALAFIAPRALEAVSVQQLTLWGLAAPAALDPALSTELRDGALLLLRADQVLYRHPIGPDAGPDAWGLAAAEVLRAAAAASPALRDAGTQGALTAFFDELFNHLDPYSRYLPPGAAGADRARRSGEAGAGITIRPSVPGFMVSDVNADGPGAEAGIKVGDRLIAVDDDPVAGESLETVQGWIRGLEGTTVRLTVRAARGRERVLDIEREVTPPETVFATRVNDMLVLRIAGFSADTDQRLSKELERALAVPRGQAVRGVVLDLRGNRGGLLRQAVSATELLLQDGVIATTAGRNAQALHEWRAGAAGDVTGGRPVVVLVDGRSASAAEIMAAALADRGRAVVVGSTTLGKGLVQTIANLPDGAELFVSWSRLLAPKGWPLQGLGVLPQVCTSLGLAAMQQQLASLDRGVQPMADALARHRAARAPLPAAETVALRNPCPAAEARDADMAAARFLLSHPAAYGAARLNP